MLRRALLTSVSSLFVAMSGSAMAQTASEDVKDGGLGEIIVTAQRREESLQDVPISVTSLNSDSLAQRGARQTEDLTLAVPGLLWGRSTNFNQPTIRGVGSRNASPGDEPNVATYFDGVYQPDQIGTLFELSNIERIEVLKGPQGTLFGRNATGGAVNIITPKPSFNFRGSISGTYGSYNYRKGTLFLTGPLIGDKVAASISAVAYGDDGYVDNIFLNVKQGKASGYVVRPKVLIQASDNVQIQLNGLYTESNNNVLHSAYAFQGNSIARTVVNRPAVNTTGIPLSIAMADKPYTTSTVIVPSGHITQALIDAHIEVDFDWATLTGIIAGGKTRGTNNSAGDATAFGLSRLYYESKTNYGETEWVLASPGGGRLNWLVGVTGFIGKSWFDPQIASSRSTTTGALTTTTQMTGQKTKSVAVFAEATWEAVPSLFLTGGLRYSYDNKFGFISANGGPELTGEASYNRLSPRFVARYEISPNTSIYASFTQGYKSGIINNATTPPTALNPEIITAYELGLKGEVSNWLRYTLAGYHYDYRDLQVSSTVIRNGVQTSTVQNAAKVKIDGFEGTVTAKIAEGLTLDASVSVLKTRINDFTNAVIVVPLPGNAGNANAFPVDVSGNELIRAPNYTFSIGANYTRRVGNGDLTLTASAFFSDSYWVEVSNRLAQPRYKVVNASATWKSDKGFYFTVFGQNLTSQVYGVGYIITSFLDSTQAAKPRWFGGTIGMEF